MILFALFLVSSHCPKWIDFNKNGRMDPYENPALSISERVEDLLGRMTLEEKSCQMAAPYGDMLGYSPSFPAKDQDVWKDGAGLIISPISGSDPNAWPPSRHAKTLNEFQRYFVEKTRLGIPVMFSTEGIKGPETKNATCFSVPLGMGSTWDPRLIYRTGKVIGKEVRALGIENIWGPVLDIGRDARWGRFEETFGEDPFLASQFAVNMIRGIQSTGTVCTSKHFGPYGFVKAGREGDARMDSRATPREVEEIGYATWRSAITEAGLENVMVCYSDYDGVPLHADAASLQGKLRKEWGMKGYAISDAEGMNRLYTFQRVASDAEDAYAKSVNAGVSVFLGIDVQAKDFVKTLRKAVRDKKISMRIVDDRVRAVLYAKFKAGLFDHPYLPEDSADDSFQSDQPVELEVSRESVVLLKNQSQLLPLNRNAIHTVAVVGPLANSDGASHKRYGPFGGTVTTLLKGIQEVAAPGTTVVYAKGCELTDKDWPRSELYSRPLAQEEQAEIDEATAVAKKSDVVICALGDTDHTSGESRTRTSLDLTGRQNDLVKAMVATGKPVIVTLQVGRPSSVNLVNDLAQSILLSFCPGSSGGRALAEAIFGDLNPGGKLNCTFPKSVGQLPLCFPTKPMGMDENLGDWSAGVVGPLYPFGYGLSYTTFAYSDLKIRQVGSGGDIGVSFQLTNTGTRPGDEVVQVYSHQNVASVTPYERRLVAFSREHLGPGEGRLVSLTIHHRDLRILDRNMRWSVEPGVFQVFVGSSSQDDRLKGQFVVGR
jgi:beta-glucosidase